MQEAKSLQALGIPGDHTGRQDQPETSNGFDDYPSLTERRRSRNMNVNRSLNSCLPSTLFPEYTSAYKSGLARDVQMRKD